MYLLGLCYILDAFAILLQLGETNSESVLKSEFKKQHWTTAPTA